MIRSVIAVVAGYAAIVLLSSSLWLAFGFGLHEIPAQRLLLLSLVFESLIALVAGYLTAWIAGGKESRHSAFLAATMVLQGTVTLVLGLGQHPLWVPLATIFVLAPCCWLGGRIRQWRLLRASSSSLAAQDLGDVDPGGAPGR